MDFLRSQLRLSLIVDASLARNRDFAGQWESLAEAGVSSLFFRVSPEDLDTATEAAFQRIADSWRKGEGYVFAIDDAVLALRLGCHGVFARAPRQSLSRMREVLGAERFLGVEVNSSDALERYASSGELRDTIDFAGVGPVLQYGDKPGMPLGVETARRITVALRSKPTFWLGGIRAEDLDGFGAGFADGITVVRALVARDVVSEARRFHKHLGGVLAPTKWTVGHPPANVRFDPSLLSADDLNRTEVPLHKLALA